MDRSKTYRVGVVGCGLIGQRRAGVVAAGPRAKLQVVTDINLGSAQKVAESYSCRVASSWHEVVADPSLDIVIVSTPNAFLAPIGIAALEAGKHVLIEKPMGRNVAEATALADAAASASRVLKVGFNHRYHPGIREAFERFKRGRIGEAINVRIRYGHGARPGYEKEWRGNPELAGGGELTDQGVHVLDLLSWFLGPPLTAYGVLQTAVWPIAPLEDNAFAILQYPNAVVASIHTTWTQWKNLFSFELFGTAGSLTVEGLGKSYGTERLVEARRRTAGGAPELEELTFGEEDGDISWAREWADFMGALEGKAYLGTPYDGLVVMTALSAIYRASKQGKVVEVGLAVP